ncbi:2-oxoglutarate dehydrogenase E1 component [Alcaligenes nematophilus]|jgi:2-oxoglutarate dehydrogenase E1 component|uniref:2-oxoglutarate dehydrogenase E1 component n=3 Tax=Alcaligenes TaxID=507 RepID=A0AAE9H915_ALCFA|nr:MULTISPECIES: 2-oxoglutarate dehydrogenase E1 component [Alcaligenes]MDH4867859.1 2-oxoglutarate dehydrogenase E1 component [Bacillus cereus]KGP01461.1 2-oxoglutarate dehydrogenase [Alcaligenes faecalis]MCM2559691.1 2-oxoglutarate dehydrogenase E1 component [Alcaligenes faecalis]MCM2620280.1 2-oxoglutarate dehydrogenase E1 component [Alcaligenes faecalis]MCX5473540.1 2-oxoglutarate dehydrogenase E1 component [Alcaligenes nematophilus]
MSSQKELLSNSYLFGSNAPYVEELYESYLDNPGSVADQWREYFDQLQHQPATDGRDSTRDQAHAPIVESFAQRAKANAFLTSAQAPDLTVAMKQVSIQSMIAAYRSLGARIADLDPLKRSERPSIPELDPAFYGLTEADLDQVYSATNTYFTKADTMTLRDMLKALRDTYSRSVGAEFMYISDPVVKRWIQQRLESVHGTGSFNVDQKRNILQQLTEAEGLERFLHTKYVGQKRFSLEGGESFIACMDEVVNHAGENGVQEIIVGMAHRGRLNMLVNIMGKMPGDLFAEFEGRHAEGLTDGDVKYHNGFSSDLSTRGGPVHLSLAFNPSHLEIVNPVVEGSVRARQDRRSDEDGSQVLPVLVHGDAAFAGQGVVMETLNLAQTRGYGTGGTLHIVINNQIGFTTSDPRDTRSTLYCTDVVKMIEAPVFHVNGDDPEAVVFVTQLALDFRREFKHDVVVDIVCFRKLGHNEQDTPSMTQPLMYKKIGQHNGTRKLYADKLVAQGILSENEPEDLVKAYRQLMEDGKRTVEPVLTDYKNKYATDWSAFLGAKWTDQADTALPMSELTRIGEKLTTVPEGFTVHPLVNRMLNDRRAMARGEAQVDWGMGEHLAFATLVNNGYAIRITGQDSGRGTFTHRHAVLHDQKRERWNDGTYIPLQNVSEGQANFTVIDSVLSEEAVLAFEYGYASAEPNILTIWEAQFGDFANGAQVVIDQFITSGEAKWGRHCGLTLMLPHGYEGQGPEHSSARIERFLQLCADNNIQVVQPTNGAQIFHVLRRQMIRPFRKPLVIMTPKSLLRNKDATSPLSDLAEGHFMPVIGETDQAIDAAAVKRVLACSGKVYYDLVNHRKELERNDIAIIRVEQLYPFAHKAFQAELAKYSNAKEVIWVQDEPQNQGAWFYVQHHIYENMTEGQKLGYAGRAASASPAVGYLAKHQEQHKALLEQAFGARKGFMLTK